VIGSGEWDSVCFINANWGYSELQPSPVPKELGTLDEFGRAVCHPAREFAGGCPPPIARPFRNGQSFRLWTRAFPSDQRSWRVGPIPRYWATPVPSARRSVILKAVKEARPRSALTVSLFCASADRPAQRRYKISPGCRNQANTPTESLVISRNWLHA